MLRRRKRTEVFAAVFFEAGRDCAGWDERDAGVFAGRGFADAAIDLDGFFGWHPSLAPLEPLFRKDQLAIVHAAGSPDPTRSHFDSKDFMESGMQGGQETEDG